MRILASKNEKEIGQPGTDAEKNAFTSGTVSIGHGKGTVMVDMPLNDRNGEPIAAVRVELKSYMLAETQDMVLDRVRIIINEMQKRGAVEAGFDGVKRAVKVCSLCRRGTNGEIQFKSVLDRNLKNANALETVKRDRLHNAPSISSEAASRICKTSSQ